MIAASREWTFRRVAWATLVFVFVALSFWLIFKFSQVLLILFIGLMIGTVIRPAVNWLYSRGLTRPGSVILVYLIIFSLIVGFVLVLFPLITEQSGKIIASLPDYYQNARNWFVANPNQLVSRFSMFLPSTLPALQLGQQTGQAGLASTEQVLSYIVTLVKAIFLGMVILLISFHWALYGSRITQSFTLMFPNTQRERARELISSMETKLSAFIFGQSLLCLAIGTMALIAYLIIGLPNALVLAFIAGVLEAVPMVGPVLGAVPAGLIALSISPTKLVWVILATVIMQTSENHLLVPRIMRRAVGVNPFVSLLSLFAFSSLLGIVGALLAIPIAALVQLILEYYVFQPEAAESEASFGRDYVSRLRYETQDLINDLRKQARHKKAGTTDLTVKQVDQLMDEIEAIASDLDSVLSRDKDTGVI